MRPIWITVVLAVAVVAGFTLRLRGRDSSSTQPSTQPGGAAWTPAWSNLNPSLTDEQIGKMSTTDLAKALFTNGVPSRVILSSNTTAVAGIGRLVDEYPGYKQFFARPDCWKGLAGMVDAFAGETNSTANMTKFLNATIGLSTIQTCYEYSPIQKQVAAHGQELIDANVRALEKIEQYLGHADPKKDQTGIGFAGMAMSALVQSTLKLESGIDAKKADALSAAIGNYVPGDEKNQLIPGYARSGQRPLMPVAGGAAG